MTDARQPNRSSRRSWTAFAFAVAAVAACWNPFAAPFGLIVGAIAVVLAARALRRSPARRRVSSLALALSVLATIASAIVILSTAGVVGVELPGEPVVKGRTQAELDRVLSEAAERTRARRERAGRELDALEGGADGGTVTKQRQGGAPPSGSTRR